MYVSLPMGFYPFWFWNDTVSADEIRWQVKEMAAQGIRGFFIHPRQGMGQPYLSTSFFEMVDVAVEAAEKQGLCVHLYDEYPYPSGIAGGEVVLGCPQYQATKLVQASYVLNGGRASLELPKGKILSCLAYPLQDDKVDWQHGVDLRDHIGIVLTRDSYLETGLTAYNQKRYFASEPRPVLEVTLPQKPHKLFVAVQAHVDHFKYWNHYVDVLNPEAISRFIALTHERYRQRYADRFGKTILSIFTDETCPRWSDRVPDALRAEYGYDLCDAMPALLDADHPDHVRVSYDLYQLVYKLFCVSFEEPVSAWCQENDLAYAGEKPSLRLSQLRYMDIPGCEPGHTKAGAKLDLLQGHLRSNAKATASAAYFYGKTGALCECYHSTGWSATLQDAKFIAEGLILMGIKYLVPHGFFYSTHALRKHDAPPTFFFQMPFWPLFDKLAERVDRIGRLFEGTHIAAEILVVDPASGIPTKQDLYTYEAILWLLMENHLDYHIVDTDILESGQIENGCIRVGDVVAKLVIMPPMRVIEKPLQEWLERYEACGGKVIHCHHDLQLEDLKAEMPQTLEPSLSIQVGGQEASPVLVVKRVAQDRTLWFVLNTSAENLHAELKSRGELREISLEPDLPATLHKEGQRYWRTISPLESFVVEATESAEPAIKAPRIKVSVGGQARLHLQEPNLLRMYDWHMSLREGENTWGPSATVPATPLANQLAQGKFRFAPVYREYFGHVPELTWPEMGVRYEFAFECDYSGPVQLVTEPGSIVGDWAIYINQAGPLKPADLKPTAVHVRGSLGTDITAFLQAGANSIRVEVVTDRPDGGLLNALYLAGDFGVALDPVRLVPRKSVGGFEQYEENLLPYYAGVIEYITEFALDRVPGGDHVIVEFDYGRPFHQATEVSINNSEYKPVLWQPRRIKLPADRLHAGQNILKTRVYTTLIRSFEGQWFDYNLHAYRDVGC
ncbi:MAG: hypothetical protein JSV36_11330 [Anaerolineae bacterium]|nr:MAG: hypothetical protein JSV36_11330 [Anaerolineae bacterium]